VKRHGVDVISGPSAVSDVDELRGLLSSKAERSLLPVVSVQLPEHCHRIADYPTSAYTKAIEDMAIKKRLTLQDMVEADVHFSRLNPRWEDYAIFPVVEFGRLVYYQGRAHNPHPEVVGKRFPSKATLPYGAQYWVYNIDEARKAKVVIVVESILNVLSLRRRLRELGSVDVAVACVFKHAVSKTQAIKLLKIRGLEELCFMFDADATAIAIKHAATFSGSIKATVAIIPPKLGPTQDANDDVDEAIRQFDARRRPSMAMGLGLRIGS
jgi:hypothetical protein